MTPTPLLSATRRLLQIIQGGLGVLALLTGALLLYRGAELTPEQRLLNLPLNAGFDSLLRFYGGLEAGVGLVLLWGIPRIEDKGPSLRAVWALVFLGGVGRWISLLQYGGDISLAYDAAIEVLAPLVLGTWQYLLHRKDTRRT